MVAFGQSRERVISLARRNQIDGGGLQPFGLDCSLARDTGHDRVILISGGAVLSTVHAATPATAIDRVIDGFSAARAPAIRAQLTAVLRAVSAQRLLPGRRGGRAPLSALLSAR